jgi:hypothetical protein
VRLALSRITKLHSVALVFGLLSSACAGDPGSSEPVDPWGRGGFVPGDPLVIAEADLESWIYVPIDGMVCGDGSPAGIFVSFTERSRELVFFLDGGGICYDDVSCALMEGELAGLGDAPVAGHRDVGIFDRGDETNPFRDASFVSVPHCTGDFHLADALNVYSIGEVHQRGYANLKTVLRRVAPTFADATRITVAGFSAGGVGVTGTFHATAQAFLTVGAPLPIMINDSGPLLRPPFLDVAGQGRIAEAWALDESLFAWCPRCETRGFHEVFARLHEIYPGLRSSLICTYDDAVVNGLYMLIALPNLLGPGRLGEGLLDFTQYTAAFEPGPEGGGQRELYYEGKRHGALAVAPLAETPNLTNFLAAQVEGREDWTTMH